MESMRGWGSRKKLIVSFKTKDYIIKGNNQLKDLTNQSAFYK